MQRLMISGGGLALSLSLALSPLAARSEVAAPSVVPQSAQAAIAPTTLVSYWLDTVLRMHRALGANDMAALSDATRLVPRSMEVPEQIGFAVQGPVLFTVPRAELRYEVILAASMGAGEGARAQLPSARLTVTADACLPLERIALALKLRFDEDPDLFRPLCRGDAPACAPASRWWTATSSAMRWGVELRAHTIGMEDCVQSISMAATRRD